MWYQEGISEATLRGTYSSLEDFFNLCFLAGPSRCAFWFDSPMAIKKAFFELDNRIHARPIPVGSKFVLNWARWRLMIFYALGIPGSQFPLMASTLALAYNNSLPSLTNTSTILPNILYSDIPLFPGTGRSNRLESTPLIACSDHPCPKFKDEEELSAYLRRRNVEIFARPQLDRYLPFTGTSKTWNPRFNFGKQYPTDDLDHLRTGPEAARKISIEV